MSFLREFEDWQMLVPPRLLDPHACCAMPREALEGKCRKSHALAAIMISIYIILK
jgi:hypothetical protein